MFFCQINSFVVTACRIREFLLFLYFIFCSTPPQSTLLLVACQNATILLAGVGGSSDPTIARGNITSLLKHLELAGKARHHMSTRRAHPAVTFFGTLISRLFSFVCLFHQSVHFFRFTFEFSFEFSFVETVPAISGRLEQHALAPKLKAEVTSRL
jgi:hypothetical protein